MRLINSSAINVLCGLGLAACLLGTSGCSSGDKAPDSSTGTTTPTTTLVPKDKVKIAFIVKKPDEPWFQLEWRFAGEAAKADGFELITLGALDGDQVVSKIETAATQGAQGLIICTPDVKLGPAIVDACKRNNLKLLTVDDQLVGPDGKFLDVPHLGISAHKIGNNVGQALMDEMKKRGWNQAETGMLVVTYEELDTARERTDGAIETATKDGFPKDKIFKAPEKGQDIADSRTAATTVLTQHPEIKTWLIASMNDAGAMGAVRATESFNFPASKVIGIGINGDSALDDLKRPQPTGLYGSILLQAKRHGADTCDMMYKWLTTGVEPPKITYTDGILITRDNYQKVLADQGLTK